MSPGPTFEGLIAEGAAVPLEGWDFSWFDGRATEERPAWGYARLLGERLERAQAALDVQTGGGEVLAGALLRCGEGRRPAVLAATESWPPNAAVARRTLSPFGVVVTEVEDEADLPYPAESFDLVVSRHPTEVLWPELARVLRHGGTYLSQQVGAGSNRELSDFMMGPQPVDPGRSAAVAVAAAGGGRAGGDRPARAGSAGRVLRCRRGRAFPAEGALDGSGFHGGWLPGAARPDTRTSRRTARSCATRNGS